jgi:formylglycine-generating enzyme required for sulfatase activity
MRLALIPPGRFTMGSATGRPPADPDEVPRHQVQISKPFYLGTHQVTQEQFVRVMRHNPSHFGPEGGGAPQVQHLDMRRLPVDSVSYEDIQEFCHRLSQCAAEKRAGCVYRLPTEAEWEYACRAGVSHTPYHFGRHLRAKFARFDSNGGGHPVPVGSYRPNLFGLHDMHGNVWEWCSDWYDEGYYTRTPERDPTGPSSGERRVLRGGGWCSSPNLCRSALRGHNTVDARHNYNGFRVALSLPGS